MKSTLLVFVGFIFLLIFVWSFNFKDNNIYIENKPSFYELRYGNWISNGWIRNPKNLMMIHETFKQLDYNTIISNNLLNNNPFILQDIFINKSGRTLLDSLELSYKKPYESGKYFREFWNRRLAEKNDSIVFVIIKEINISIKNRTGGTNLLLPKNQKLVNDTLSKLIQIEFSTESPTKHSLFNDFNYYKQIGLHQSAYNLLFVSQTYTLKINRDSLIKTLNRSNQFVQPWFRGESK